MPCWQVSRRARLGGASILERLREALRLDEEAAQHE
jgi:hypothetical protein